MLKIYNFPIEFRGKSRETILLCRYVVNDDEFDWKSACISREEEHKRWYNHEEEMDFFRFREGIFAAVDSVKIMEVCCIDLQLFDLFDSYSFFRSCIFCSNTVLK